MQRRQVGVVKELRRFPVKSMLGETVSELAITKTGAAGDRALALRDLENRRIVTAKKFAAMLSFRAEWEGEPGSSPSPRIRITLPGGQVIHADDPGASEAISAALSHRVQLERAPHPNGERAGIDPRTVFGDVPIGNVIPGMTPEAAPDFFNLSQGTFFDSAAIHLLATGTLEHMSRIVPGSVFDPRRFRVNIVVDTGAEASGFVEDGWLKGTLEVGDGVKIAGMKPALRCVMTTHPQENLSRDMAVLRAAVQHHSANLGIFASVDSPGGVRIGDPVFLVG